MKITKMQGLGNDYIYVYCTEDQIPDPASLARRISDRHFGVGSDGLVLILPCKEADFRMRMFNADGSESEMCGNATRCIAKYIHDRGLSDKEEIRLMTGAGIKILKLSVKEGKTQSVRVDMGEPILEASKIPVLLPEGKTIGASVEVFDQTFRMTCVSMGNPHAVIFVEDADRFDVHRYGAALEAHQLFPRKTNVEFVTVKDREHLRMRVWERGSGETLACGTGACATLVATVLNGLCERKAVLELNGGPLTVEWDPETNHVFQEGPAEFVFDAEYE
jgi:diaminopimelate epimerase